MGMEIEKVINIDVSILMTFSISTFTSHILLIYKYLGAESESIMNTENSGLIIL